MKSNQEDHLENNLFNLNPFSDAFTQFEEDTFYETIHNKVKNQSYYQKYKGFKNTILAVSYLFNAASILSASYAVFWITAWITGIVWVGYVLAGIFLFFLEKLKRKSSNEFFQYYFFRNKIAYGWLSLSLFCLVISLSASSFGTKEGVENLSPDPNLIAADSLATLYRGEIEQLKQENKEFSLQKDHTGTIYYKLQSVIKANKLMISDYNSRIIELDKKLEGHNAELSKDYEKDVKTTAWIMVLTIILMELFFECCLAYVWYFNLRTYVEHKKTQKLDSLNSDVVISNASQTSANNHFIPPSQQSKSKPETPSPIGFDLSHKKKTNEGIPLSNTKSPVQVCTETKTSPLIDAYTVEHQYNKNGSIILVHYTHAQILARINQYRRGIDEALKKKLGKDILANREKWLIYWLDKEKELTLKRKNVFTS